MFGRLFCRHEDLFKLIPEERRIRLCCCKCGRLTPGWQLEVGPATRGEETQVTIRDAGFLATYVAGTIGFVVLNVLAWKRWERAKAVYRAALRLHESYLPEKERKSSAA